MRVVDPAARIIFLNRYAERTLGYGRDELLGQLADTLVPERLRIQHVDLRQLARGSARAADRGQEIVVIDDDLGRSGSGVSRPGFERLLAAICEGRAGAVFGIEASRLARNGRDWHTLIEFCQFLARRLRQGRRQAQSMRCLPIATSPCWLKASRRRTRFC